MISLCDLIFVTCIFCDCEYFALNLVDLLGIHCCSLIKLKEIVNFLKTLFTFPLELPTGSSEEMKNNRELKKEIEKQQAKADVLKDVNQNLDGDKLQIASNNGSISSKT